MENNLVEEKKLPQCFGTYDEGDENCDGDGETEACMYRSRCGAFRRYLGTKRNTSSKYLIIDDDGARAKHGNETFLRFCEQLLRDENAKKVKRSKQLKLDPNRDKRKDGPCADAKRKSRKTKARRAKEKRQKLLMIFEEFRIEFERKLKKRTFAASDQIISIGQFYVSDRVKTSDYIGIRCKTSKGVDRSLVNFKLKTSTLSFDIKLPFSFDELSSELSGSVFKKLSPVEREEGQFKTIILDCKKEKVGLICEFLYKSVNDDVIELPKI